MADTVVLPVMADMAALKAAANTMRIFKAVKIPEDRVRVILNELIPRAGLTRQQVEASLGQSVHNLPHAGSGFIDALNAGTPLVAAEPPCRRRGPCEFARSLCEPEESQVVETKSTRANLLGKLRRA
jgi:Flp pilus assembly CpaE family ATPase